MRTRTSAVPSNSRTLTADRTLQSVFCKRILVRSSPTDPKRRLLTREEMKKCVWLRPQLIAQIEFTEWTPDNHLRQSKFLGLRDDKDPREIMREE